MTQPPDGRRKRTPKRKLKTPEELGRRRRGVSPVHLRSPAVTALTVSEQRFVEEGVEDEDWLRAARVAWPEREEHRSFLREVLATPRVASAVAAARRRALGLAEIKKSWVVRRLVHFATADVNELVEGRRVACRHCYGVGGRYQFRDHEVETLLVAYDCGSSGAAFHQLEPYDATFASMVEAYYELGKAGRPFDPQGDRGYTTSRSPNPECTACDGDGTYHVVFKDTRYLSARAQLLYDGCEVRSDGSVKLNIRDRMWAEKALLMHAGVAIDRKEIAVRVLDPAQLTEDELRYAIAQAEAASTFEIEGELAGEPPEASSVPEEAEEAEE